MKNSPIVALSILIILAFGYTIFFPFICTIVLFSPTCLYIALHHKRMFKDFKEPTTPNDGLLYTISKILRMEQNPNLLGKYFLILGIVLNMIAFKLFI